MLDICRPSNIYIFVYSLSPFDKSESKFNRPFYQYGGRNKFIRFKEYYGIPRGGTRSLFMCALWAKRELRCIFLGKKSIIINTAQQSFSTKT